LTSDPTASLSGNAIGPVARGGVVSASAAGETAADNSDKIGSTTVPSGGIGPGVPARGTDDVRSIAVMPPAGGIGPGVPARGTDDIGSIAVMPPAGGIGPSVSAGSGDDVRSTLGAVSPDDSRPVVSANINARYAL
jgi:hypothetical protein